MDYKKENVKIAKLLCFVLRHKPESIGLSLDKHGWAVVDDLVRLTPKYNLTVDRLHEIANDDDKMRFAFSDDNTRIRANQGHSIDIEPDFEEATPPDLLYHGTAERFLKSILSEGVSKQKRHHVHLSENMRTASEVGKRYGKPVILFVDAKAMLDDGYTFFRTLNNVWLVEHIPPRYLITPSG